MPTLAARLYRLQQLDTDLDARRAQRDALRWDLQADPAVERAQEQWQQADAAWQQAERALRRAEDDIRRLRDKLRREETRLYSGEVTNPKELQALQMEVQSLRRRLDTLEDQALALLMAAEEAEAARRVAQQTLAQAQAAWERRRAAGQETLARLEEDIAALQSRRDAVWQTLPPEAQALYQRLRARRGGVAVAGVREGSCLACGATLSTAVVQQVRTSPALVHCPSCGRILYALD